MRLLNNFFPYYFEKNAQNIHSAMALTKASFRKKRLCIFSQEYIYLKISLNSGCKTFKFWKIDIKAAIRENMYMLKKTSPNHWLLLCQNFDKLFKGPLRVIVRCTLALEGSRLVICYESKPVLVIFAQLPPQAFASSSIKIWKLLKIETYLQKGELPLKLFHIASLFPKYR